MPHKVSDSTSSLSSSGSSRNGVVVTDMRGSHAGPRRTQAPVIIHNQGGQIYDETRPSDWDKQRWK
ncbi:uncharacterized protein BO72DRAFT_493033 [Aspergillus fijiensis CBS 313.89]|uniref:Uncharacterized protein n=1 Tax=Aspergillus fijiensis CBS 313.89 TaxID=1448319 RepID=A0A8G1W2I8_9EURO|nr:uncharacterized protein BO72DRAFT_493033 [Aspergillus fijiensis CBS 313.89]RAK80506.1 hypothetical protein BO72DRAFT_493033 [Aspergillus fijiensis CBS 313.89]